MLLGMEHGAEGNTRRAWQQRLALIELRVMWLRRH